MANRSVSVALRMEVSNFIANGGKAVQTARQLKDELKSATDTAKGRRNLDELAMAAASTGAVMAAGFGVIVKAAADFDKQMSAVGAVSNATAGELDQLRQAAIKAGADTQFSATEAAKAQEELAKAGLSTSDILGGALAGSLDLAAAGSLDLAEAADVAAKTMNVFGLHGQNVTHIADVLSAAANKSATDVHEMGQALKQGGLAANAAGMGLEETAGTLAAFADRALIGSDAGTSLKTMLMMLQAPTDKAASLMKELGIRAYDAQGNFVGTAKLAGELQKALGGMTQEQRNAALATIFGADAMRAANVLYTVGEQGIRDYVAAVDDQGAAAETAAKKTDNLAGDIERLTGSLETLAIEAGSGANDGLRALVQAADAGVEAFSDLPGPVQTTITVLMGAGGAGLLAAAGFLKVKSTAGDALAALRDMGPAGTKAADGLGKVGRVAGRATLWGVALLGAYEASRLFIGFLNRDIEPARRDVEAMTKALKDLADTGRVTGELAKAFGPDLRDLRKHMDALNVATQKLPKGLSDSGSALGQLGRGMVDTGRAAAGLNDEILKAANQSKENFDAVDKALAELVNQGGVTQAKIAFDELASRWMAAGLPLADLMKMFPQYAAAAAGAAEANTGLARGFGDASSNARTMAASLEEAVSKGQSLIDVWNQLHGATLSFDEAQIRAKDSLDAVKKSFEENGKAIEGNSRRAVENRVAVGQAAQAAAEAAQRKYEETGSVTDANKVYDSYIAQLRKTLDQAGLTDEQIETLISSYASMPKSVTTKVNADTAAAEENLTTVKGLIAAIKSKRVVITVDVRGRESVRVEGRNVPIGDLGGRRWGGIDAPVAMASGGIAAIYGASNPPLIKFAEPETGGEAYIPRFGDWARSVAIGRRAMEWYGMDVVPKSATVGRQWVGTPGVAANTTASAPADVTQRHYYYQPREAHLSKADWMGFVAWADAEDRVGRPR